MDVIRITDAVPGDIDGILAVRKETWLSTYPNKREGISYDDLEAKLAFRQIASHESLTKLILDDPFSRLWVAKDADRVIGFSGAQKADTNNRLSVLYVLPHYQRHGIGKRLLERTLAWLGREKSIVLEVVSYNETAIRFYRKFGFTPNGPAQNAIARLPSGKIMPETEMILCF
jgi:ribosomal protein S18 acetylase RimI-like enzyme